MSSLHRPLPSYRRQGSFKRLIFGILIVTLGVLFLGSVLGNTVINSFTVRSISMEPSLKSGDVLLNTPFIFGKTTPFSNKSFLDFGQPRRGDIVLVFPPYHLDLPFYQKVFDTVLSFISLGRVAHHSFNQDERIWEASLVYRRVIALPGDEIYMNGGQFFVRPKGKQDFGTEQSVSGTNYSLIFSKLKIAQKDMIFSDEMQVMTVPNHTCFVAADNRGLALDSRNWGAVDLGNLRGQALLRYWPPSRFGQVR